MGNTVTKTPITPGNTDILYVIASTDGSSAYFNYNLYRNSSSAFPAFTIVLGAQSNTQITASVINESNGSVVNTTVIDPSYSIGTSGKTYTMDICGQTLLITDAALSSVIASYSNFDLENMSIIGGTGSTNTQVVMNPPTSSVMTSCGTTASSAASSFIVTSSMASSIAASSGLEWWAILLIVLAAVIVVTVAAVLAWYFTTGKKSMKK
jgi:hypothetical protein